MEKYQNSVESCLAVIKGHVKSRKITYRELAEKLNVSELTIKRRINARDISMSKLLALCDAAEVDFSEAWDSLSHQKPMHSMFSKQHDDAFFKNPNLMSFFFELYANRKIPSEIQKEYGLTDASLYLYLRKLEQIDLIQVSAQQKVSFNIQSPVGFDGNSRVLKKELSLVFKDLVATLAEGKQVDGFLVSRPFQLSGELKERFFEEIVDVVSRYAELSEKYFAQSGFDVFEFVACEFRQVVRSKTAVIENLKGFN